MTRAARDARTLRIIAGTWRGRRFRFPDIADIRPTPNRVRETLFNWLQRDIPGAVCLDLFAGSGALGLEALSRGAKWVTFVDRDARVTAHLQHQLNELKVDNAAVIHSTAHDFLRQPGHRFDVVFLDPPFQGNDLQTTIEILADPRAKCAMTEHGWVHLELPVHTPLPTIPDQWRLHRDSRAGQVRSVLLATTPPKPEVEHTQ